MFEGFLVEHLGMTFHELKEVIGDLCKYCSCPFSYELPAGASNKANSDLNVSFFEITNILFFLEGVRRIFIILDLQQGNAQFYKDIRCCLIN